MKPNNRLILITNDDGIHAVGLKKLISIAAKFGKIFVIAPDREMSGAGHSLTLRTVIRMRRTQENYYAVEGSPCDCVNMAIWHLLDRKPDLVLSGINNGWNIGEDALYSGTIAGAMEGAIHHIPSIAFSCKNAEPASFENAKEAIIKIIKQVMNNGLPKNSFLNVNMPALPFKEFKITALSARKNKNIVMEKKDPRGEKYYWLARAEPAYHANENSDISALQAGYISITPLTIDITDYKAMQKLSKWNF
jgi:5'-nucleotidase